MLVSDEELTLAIGSSEPQRESNAALEELYRRHRPAVFAYAQTCCRDVHTAEDLTSEAFTRTIAAVEAGRGPTSAWRPYLLAVVRRTAADWAATARRVDLAPDFDRWLHTAPVEQSGEDIAIRREDDALLTRSFQSLPERWQSVLWHTVIEREPTEQVAALLGIGPSGVGSLAARAREGLREAYLGAYIESADRPECRRFSHQLAAAVRRTSRRHSRHLARHLDGCDHCRRAMTDLTDLNARMRQTLPGALLGWALPHHLAAVQTGSTAAAAGAAAVGTGHTAGTGAVVGVGTASIVIAAVVAGFLLHGGGSSHTGAPAPTPTGISTIASSPSPIPHVSQPTLTQTPTPSLPKAAAITQLRVQSTGRCMEVLGGVGAQPQEAPCNGTATQVWELVRNASGRLQLRNQASKLCLTYPAQLPDGAVVRQLDCGAATRGQWWDYVYSQQNGTIVFDPIGDSLRRLGVNEWNKAGPQQPHSPTIGITRNYYNTAALIFTVDKKLFA